VATVFYSWQADTSTLVGRNLIERALEKALGELNKGDEVEEAQREELAVDRDTMGVAGSPPIVQTIFDKIDRAAVFVPDLTFVGKRLDDRPTPNPNVLIEYGWALKSLTHSRIVPVMNVAFGAPRRRCRSTCGTSVTRSHTTARRTPTSRPVEPLRPGWPRS